MDKEIKNNNPKTSARLLAVQTYYSMLIDKNLDKNSAIKSALAILEKENVKVKKKFAEELLDFSINEKDSIEAIIKKYLEKDKTFETMNPLIFSILAISISELLKDKETDRPIIISEYLALSSDFFGKNETGFINAILDKFSKSENL